MLSAAGQAGAGSIAEGPRAFSDCMKANGKNENTVL